MVKKIKVGRKVQNKLLAEGNFDEKKLQKYLGKKEEFEQENVVYPT